MTTLTLLHPGAMGAAVGGQAVRNGHTVLWVPSGRSEASAARADLHALTRADDLASALGCSEVVLSICPPAYAEDVSDAVAGTGFAGVYVDANAISPDRMLRIAVRQRQSGASPVDGAVIGSPPSETGRPRLYLAGQREATELLVALFADTQVVARPLDRPLGAVSALKMAYGGYQKASRALVAVSHALASEYDVADALTAEGRSMQAAVLGRPEDLPGAAAKGWRWAPEMEEVAATLDSLGLPPDLARAAATVMRRWDDDKDDDRLSVADVLDHLKR